MRVEGRPQSMIRDRGRGFGQRVLETSTFGRRFKSDPAHSGVFVGGLGSPAGVSGQRQDGQRPLSPLSSKYFYSSWCFESVLPGVPAGPDAGSTHFLSASATPQHESCTSTCSTSAGSAAVEPRPGVRVGGWANGSSLVSESVSWRATSSGMYSHVKHNTCTVCVGRQKKPQQNKKKNKNRFPQ